MAIFQSKCEECGTRAYIFPDQVQTIKKRDNLKLSPYVREKLYAGKDWFCIKCDSGGKVGTNCRIIGELPSKTAEGLLKVRERETNLLSQGFYLLSLY